MRIFKSKWFARYAKREKITDQHLVRAIQGTERGLVGSDLGSGLVKLRVARSGQGKSSGYRLLVAYKAGRCAFFLYGFAKNEKDNIPPHSLESLRDIGSEWLATNREQLDSALEEGLLQEVYYDKKKET